MSFPNHLEERHERAVLVVDMPAGPVVFTRDHCAEAGLTDWLDRLIAADSTSCHYCTRRPSTSTDSHGRPRCTDCTDAAIAHEGGAS